MPGEFAFSAQLFPNSRDIPVYIGWRFTLAMVILSLFLWPVGSPAETKGWPSPLVVVTSFPESPYLTVSDAFTPAHPQIDVLEFTCSYETGLLPASIAVIKGAPNWIGARKFIDFLLFLSTTNKGGKPCEKPLLC
jgi:hypothetical protein